MFKLIALIVLFCVSLSIRAQTFEKTVSISALKEGANRYFYVPFEVPAKTKSLTLSYRYDRKDGANVVDLGVFDARFEGTQTNIKGFRGWSGGRRNTIFIAENSATNGYIAGKIPAGTWRVILGLYKVAPEGVEVTIKVKINEIDQAAQAELAGEKTETYETPKSENSKSESRKPKWFKGDLHAHTFHSDGIWTVKGLLDAAGNNNLDFISITDHNTFSHHAEIDSLAKNYKNFLVLRGEEVTTYGGHFNVWGLPSGEIIDFRVAPKNTSRINELVADAHSLGALASINHPFAFCGGCDWSYGDWQNFESVEIWNGEWDISDETALKKWDELLQKGSRITAIGSSDTHRPIDSMIGFPTNHIGAKRLTQTDLFAAIKSGRVFISAQPEFDLNFTSAKKSIGEEITDEMGGEIRFQVLANNFPDGAKLLLISGGKTVQEILTNGENFSREFAVRFEKSGYARLEVRGADGKMLALTNPIFINIKQ
ncbi:CehA/McbA family metallohydrolase [soil metagenome]